MSNQVSIKNIKMIRILILLSTLCFSVTACLPSQLYPKTHPSPTSTEIPSSTFTPIPTQTTEPTLTLTPQPTRTLPPTETPTQTSSPQKVIDLTDVLNLKESGKFSITNPYRVTWSGDSLTFGVINQNSISVFDAQSLQAEKVYTVQEPNLLLDFSSDGHTIATTTDHGIIELWDIRSNTKILSFNPTSMFNSAHFSPDGKLLVLDSLDEISANLYDVSNGKLLRKYTGFETAAPVYNVSFSPDGLKLIWNARADVQIMDIATGKFGPSFSHEDFVSCTTISPDGKVLVTSAGGTVDGNFIPLINIWDTVSGKSTGYIKTTSVVTSLAYNKSGDLLAAGDGHSLEIYDVIKNKIILALEGHSDTINSIALSPDGTTLATTSFDNTVRLWQISP